MTNACFDCGRFIGLSDKYGILVCDRWPDGIPHALIMGLEACADRAPASFGITRPRGPERAERDEEANHE